jgi:hypothetical protein
MAPASATMRKTGRFPRKNRRPGRAEEHNRVPATSWLQMLKGGPKIEWRFLKECPRTALEIWDSDKSGKK